MGNFFNLWTLDQNIAFITISVLAFVLLIAYGWTAVRLERLQKELRKDEGEKIKEAEEEADKIVRDALQRSREILAYAEKFEEEERAKLSTMAEKILKKSVEEMTVEVRDTIDDEIRGFGHNLAAELKVVRQSFEIQLDRYRQQVIADMKIQADQKLKQIIEEVLQGGITRQTHERLLREALERAGVELKDAKEN